MKAAKGIAIVSRFLVSSDDADLLALGERNGFRPLPRPPELATATAQHADVLDHAVPNLALTTSGDGILLVLLANAPVVTREWLQDCIDLLQGDSMTTSVIPCYEDPDHHPLRALNLGKNGHLGPFVATDHRTSTNRQDLPQALFACHNFWVIRVTGGSLPTDGLPWPFFGSRAIPYLMPGQIFDIHAVDDVPRIERVLRKLGCV